MAENQNTQQRPVRTPEAGSRTHNLGNKVVASSGRELIDARGSIDSRTFNEEGRISSIAKDKRDRHEAMVRTETSNLRWSSRSSNVGFSGGVLSSGSDYGRPDGSSSSVPLFFKIAVPVIVLLVIAIIVLVVK